MSILYDEDQSAIARETHKMLGARYDKTLLLELLERKGEIDQDLWQTCCEQGWPSLAISEDYGGLGLSIIESGIVAEVAGHFTLGFPFFSSNSAAAFGLSQYADPVLRQSLLPKVASGAAIGCLAFSEPGWVLPTAPSVKLNGNRMVGSKPAVQSAGRSDFALVLASQNEKPALVHVDLRQPEVRAETLSTFDNSRCAADLQFDGCAFDILISGEEAFAAARLILSYQSVLIAHEQTGGAQAVLNIARDYALERRAFGQVIGAFQSVKHRIAEMYALVELARANALHAASLEQTDQFVSAAAAARLMATEAYDTSIRDAIQIHGGIGVTWEAGLHLHQRRARTLAIESGSSAFWEDLVVDQLLENVS